MNLQQLTCTDDSQHIHVYLYLYLNQYVRSGLFICYKSRSDLVKVTFYSVNAQTLKCSLHTNEEERIIRILY